MKTSLKFLVVFTLTLPAFFAGAIPTSYACSCIPPGTVDEELEKSTAVFRGTVLNKEIQNKDSSLNSSAAPVAVLFDVKETWKGVDQSKVVIYTNLSSASCGFEFELNGEYIVYAYEKDGKLHVSLCSRTTSIDSADEDLSKLKDGETPAENQTSYQHSLNNIDPNVPVWLYAGLAILIGSSFFLVIRFKK